jgi:signal transduction histidine kinase/tetratricopeptide (TPR) repeat protein
LIKHKNNLPKYYFIIVLIFANILANPIYAINDNEELNNLLSQVDHYESAGNSIKSIEANAKLLEVAKEQNDFWFQIKALNKIAHRNIDANKFLSGFDAIEQSIALAHKLKSDSILEYLFIYKSKVLLKIDNVDGAIFYLLKAKKIIDKQKDNNALAFYYNSLANLYFNQKEFDKAIDTYRSAAKCYYAINNYYYYRGSIDNIGICYRNLNDFDSAEFYFNQAISIAQNKHSKIGEVNSLINLSKNYFFKKQFKQAIDIGNIVSGEILKNNLSKYFLFENTISIANIYSAINDLAKFDSTLIALNWVMKSIPTSLNERLLYYELLKNNYKKSNQKEAYITAFENFILIKDSISNLKLLKLENGINDKFEIANKIDNYSELLQDLKIKEMENKWIIIFSIVFLIVVIILVYLFYKAKININQLKKLQEEVNKQNKELSLFNKQKDYILATVAHDLRGPVGNIKTITGVISMDDELNEENQNLVQLINQSADLSLNIINDLADAINVDRKTELLKQDKVVLSEVLNSAIVMQKDFIERKKINIHTEFFAGLEIKGDKSLIIRVFFNLISNAIKFSNVNSTIDIETSLYDKSNVLVRITDHGIGIDSDKLFTIFEPFTQASRRGTAGEKSIGLGLSICKKIVELHNGKIWVESKTNVGSEFFVVLPLNYLNQILKNIPFDI